MTEKRVAIVTGGSRGIGAAIVARLAADGMHAIAVARDGAKLEEIVKQAKDAGGSAEALSCDVSDGTALAAAIDSIAEKHGRIDVLVNNAGITRDGLVLRMDDEDFDVVIKTNLKSAFVAIRAAARPMIRAKWGRIVNVSSVSGVVGNAGQANYAASKAGLIGLAKSVAKELAVKNVTCNVVAPGFITTDMTDVLPDQLKEQVRNFIPLKRFGTSKEVASAVSFLAGPDSGYITGQVLLVDGGMVM